LLLLISFMQ